MPMNLGEECETIEFKESLGQLDKGVKSLSAMLNRQNHGSVFFGVDDEGNVIGMDVGKSTTERIRNAVRNYILPQIVPEIEVHTTPEGKEYIELRASGYNVPYSFDGRYFIRNVSSDESAGPDIVTQMVMSKGIDPLKTQPSDEQSLSFDQLFSMMAMNDFHPRNDMGFYRSHGMVDAQGRFNLTAYLVSDQNRVHIQVVRFNGTDRASVSTRTDFGGGCLIRSMKVVLEHMASYMVTRVDLSKGTREETHLFDFESFREAWVNACVHNAWRVMVPPSVLVFDDRIEVVSYGTVPFPLSLEGFYNGDSRPVNRSLFELFTALNMTEQSGHGVPTIVNRYGRDAFNISDNGVVVTIPYAFEPDYVLARKENQMSMSKLDEASVKVIRCLRLNPTAKLIEVSEDTGLSLSSVKKVVSRLKSEGLLTNEGTNRNSLWVINI